MLSGGKSRCSFVLTYPSPSPATLQDNQQLTQRTLSPHYWWEIAVTISLSNPRGSAGYLWSGMLLSYFLLIGEMKDWFLKFFISAYSLCFCVNGLKQRMAIPDGNRWCFIYSADCIWNKPLLLWWRNDRRVYRGMSWYSGENVTISCTFVTRHLK